MVISSMESEYSRREFLKNTARGLAGLMVAGHWLGNLAYAQEDKLDWRNKRDGMTYGRLGRTNFMMSRIAYGCGGIKPDDVRLLRAAFEKGVNYLDTARVYTGGESEKAVKEFVKGRRDQVWITSKAPNIGGFPESHVGKGEDQKAGEMFRSSFEESLKVLDCDYIDCYFIHGVDEPWKLHFEPIYAEVLKFKEQGKLKYFGFSSHTNTLEVLKEAATMDWYDVIMPAINPANLNEFKEVLAKLKEKDIGVVGMKTTGKVKEEQEKEVYGTDFEKMTGLGSHERSYLYMLNHAEYAGCVSHMTSFEHIQKNLPLATMKLSKAYNEELERLVREDMKGSCTFCGECSKTCSKGIEVANIVRYQSYFHQYSEQDLGRELYGLLGKHKTGDNCVVCEACSASCPQGLNLQNLLQEAHRILTV